MSRLQFKTLCLGSTLTILFLGFASCGSAQAKKSTPTESIDPYFDHGPVGELTASGMATPAVQSISPQNSAALPQVHPASSPMQLQSEVNSGVQKLKPILRPIVGAPRGDSVVAESRQFSLPNKPDFNIANLQPIASVERSDPATESNRSAAIVPTLLSHSPPELDSVAHAAVEDSTDSDTASLPTDEIFEPGRVLVVVGGRPILVGDMLHEINSLIEEHAQRAPERQKVAQRHLLVPRMLPKFVDRQLIYVDSVRGLPEGADIEKINESLGKSFDDEALPVFLKKSELPSSAQFDAQLRASGSSLRQFRQSWIDDQFVKYSISQRMQDNDEISYQELKDYYEQHGTDYQFPARAKWEQLLVRFDRLADRQAAQRLIAEMGNEVVYGASLDAVAKKSSHDFKANEGGQQGWITQGSLASTELDQAIFQIPLNQLSDVIETPAGLHIVRVLERTPAGATPFREAQVEIKEKMLQTKQERRFEDYLSKLRREIPIEVVDRSIQLPEQYIVR